MSWLIGHASGVAKEWPAGEPRRRGERCEMSDLLVDECACRKHKPAVKPETREAEPEEFDFS